MHPSSSPNDTTCGQFPAIMRHKTIQPRRATQTSSLQHPPMDHRHEAYACDTTTLDTCKDDRSDADHHPRLPQQIESTVTTCGVPEFATPKRLHHTSQPPRRKPKRPPSRLHTRVRSRPNLHRLTHPYQQIPSHFYPFQSRALAPIAKPHCTDISIMVGHPSLRIHRLHLPRTMLHLLYSIVLGCEAYAATQPHGWHTELYSLTKQDMALREIPHLFEVSKPIIAYITKCMSKLWGVERLTMDKNQPHVLKYGYGHTGVELHHDTCDITANLCMSRTSSYVGGG